MVFTFWNGYYLGKCNCSGSNSVSDTLQLMNLKIINTRLKEDSTITRNDINQLTRKIDYEILRNSNDPIELNNYSINLSNLNVKDTSLQNIKLVVADILKYKSDVISNLNDLIESKKAESKSLTETLNEKFKELKKLNNKIEDKK